MYNSVIIKVVVLRKDKKKKAYISSLMPLPLLLSATTKGKVGAALLTVGN
jgi:hypothetical protein